MNKQTNTIPVWMRILIVDIISVFGAYYLVNYLDILTTDYRWIQWMKVNGLFHVYDSWNIELPFDYPPAYIVWLYLIRNLVGTAESNYTQLIMKSLPLIAQFISQIFIYSRISEEAAWKWTVNYALLVNIVIYGQRDGIMGILIILLFYFMEKEKWLEPAVVVTVLCLIKPQGIYFIFILVLYYISKHIQLKRILLAATVSITIAYLAFLPFAITSGDWLISVKLYLYEFKIHKVFGSMAGNLWGLFEYWRLPPFIERISILFVISCFVIGVITYLKTGDFMYTTILYMMSLFMFTIAQHGRYTIYTMFILFAAIFLYEKNEYTEALKTITASTALAQLGLLLFNRILVEVYGLDVVNTNTSVQMTLDMLFRLQRLRYIIILSTFALNVICIIQLLKCRPRNVVQEKDLSNET